MLPLRNKKYYFQALCLIYFHLRSKFSSSLLKLSGFEFTLGISDGILHLISVFLLCALQNLTFLFKATLAYFEAKLFILIIFYNSILNYQNINFIQSEINYMLILFRSLIFGVIALLFCLIK
jgi:hypothetical protein